MPEPFGKMVYMASPFTHADKAVEEFRYTEAAKACGWLMNNVPDIQCFYSPIASVHLVAKTCKLPGHWEYWATVDECILSRCTEIWTLCIPGWKTSTGVNAERKIAARVGLGEKFVVPNPDGTYSITDSEPAGE